jgi:ELWxxDGT repeat protein
MTPAPLVARALKIGMLAGLASVPLKAQAPYRVADLNPDTWNETRGGLCTRDYGSLHVGRLPGFVFADPAGDGCVIYEVEPAAGTMTPVAHLGEVGARVEEVFGAAGSVTFFEGVSAASGRELWSTDGTPEGTFQLIDATPGPQSTISSRIFSPGEPWSYFFIHQPGVGWEPWRTDGTPEGTALLADLEPGEGGSVGWHATGFLGSLFFFVAQVGDGGPEIWRTDGTEAGTFAVTSLDTEEWSSVDVDFAALPSAMLFTVRASLGPVELWRSDGSAGGTQLLVSIPVANQASIRPLAVRGDLALLEIDSGGTILIWLTDGTAGGTELVTTLAQAATPRIARPLPVTNGWLFFARDAAHGVEPWTTDGTAAGTHLVADVFPGPESSATSSQSYATAKLGDRVLLRLDDGVHGFEMWISDGTAAGTHRVSDFESGREDSWFHFLGQQDGYELFEHEGRVWRTDGTTAGTLPVAEPGRVVSPSDPVRLARVGDQVYFDARPAVWDLHPARSDGSEAGTDWLGSPPFDWLGVPTHFAALGDDAFVANSDYEGDGSYGYSLLWSDDDADDPLAKLIYGCGARCSTGLGHAPPVAGGFALFADWTEPLGGELWRTDGTPAGTSLLIDLVPGSGSGAPSQIVQAGDEVWFTAFDDEVIESVWRSRGTPETTEVVGVLPEITEYYFRPRLWPIDPAVGSYLVQRYEDGTVVLRYSAGYGQPLVVVATDVASYESKLLGVVNDRVLFAGRSYVEPATGTELWVTDGTPAGTRLLRDIWPGEPDSAIGTGVVVGGKVVFPACEPVGGCELWASDGTEAGTGRLLDLEPGPGSSLPYGLSKIGSRVHFVACTVADGCEGYVSNGSAAGTVRMPEIAPGPLSSIPLRWPEWYDWSDTAPDRAEPAFVEAGDRIFFAADDGTGTELWAIVHGLFRDGFETGDTSRWSGVIP